MPQSNHSSHGKPKRRAVRACRFCRSRKIKCTGEEPICSNCRTYDKTCVYEDIVPDSLSFASRRRQVKKYNATPGAKQAATASPSHAAGSSAPGAGADQVSPAISEHSHTPNSNQRLSRMLVSPNGAPSYHGRTSALFEEPGNDWPVADPAKPHMTDDWIEKSLVTRATKQRQLEEVNYHSGKLDFDGVDPELGMHLLSLHWNRQHHSFLLTYRPAFMRDMACNGPYFSKLLLNSIYFGASKFSTRCEVRKDANDVRTAGWRFRQRVRDLLGQSLDRSEITTIQALLVMTNSLFALGDERSAAWLYAGIAFRMIVDLGMHVEPPDLANTLGNSDEDLEIRRRVFWGAFVVDKIQSLYQGRPVTLKESDTLVPVKFLDTYEELEYWKPFAYPSQSSSYRGSPAYSVSTFTALCKLSVTMSNILSSIYAERSFNKSEDDLLKMREELNLELTIWKQSLPHHLAFDFSGVDGDIPPPHVFSLHAMYYVLQILLHRPFVADGHLLSTPRPISVNALKTCAAAAAEIVRLIRAYHNAFSVKRAPYLISYATYVAATVHVRIASKRAADSNAYSHLESCLAVFVENQETNWAVRRAAGVVQNLMRRLEVSLPHGRKPQVDPEVRNRENVANENHSVEQVSEFTQMDGSYEPSVYSESLDIDGIIQSFGPGNYISHGIAQPQETQIGTSGPQGPAAAYMGETAQRGEAGHFGLATSVGLQSDTENYHMVGGSVDDLLFGFNGSALDNYPLWQWDET
ncbi:unnamed protein product [Clonostachys rosea f. rosea IK726]|uniref:Zn(2)-C6 fungal-type domain-containing protein n=2 Tax=Bionectria ochroleuca TaxID=29856 RepID=A0A0B7KPT9_BIOOC|nr:unnamed protein product [Clonostachys rosea f. rosea IK726]